MNKQTFLNTFFAKLSKEKRFINGINFQNKFKKDGDNAWKEYESNSKTIKKEAKASLKVEEKNTTETK